MTNSLHHNPEDHTPEGYGLLEIDQSGFDRPEIYVLGNAELPIAAHRAEIEHAIDKKDVIIIGAPTGAGKTSQVPQIVREMKNQGRYVFDEIILTQPRILGARELSERITVEVAHVKDDHVVGYKTSREGSDIPQHQLDIAVLTDGKAEAQLMHRNNRGESDKKRILIIDEVHEWNVHIEMLVALAAKMTDKRSPLYDKNLKVVVMSATMDSERLSEFFAHADPAVIEVSVPMHEVVSTITERSVAEVALKMARATKGTIIAFQAGKGEIHSVATTLAQKQAHLAEHERVPVVPLHGELSKDEQKKAFLDYPNGVVVAATNAAETSVTLPHAVAVVDSGEVRVNHIRYDLVPDGNRALTLGPAAEANLKQRRGRVGRTGPGEYVLASQKGGELPLPLEAREPYPIPDIQRTSLDGFLLRLKATGFEPKDFRFFHEPPKQALEAARRRLFVLGALDEDGVITKRGLRMERLPLEPEFACMLQYAEEQGYRPEVKQYVLDIAAIMQRGGILKRASKEQAWRQLLTKDLEGQIIEDESDYIAQLEAYVELRYTVPREEWEKYDIIEYHADLVEEARGSLAKAMGVPLHNVTTVAPEFRQDVLSCIHAGQLNQLWQRHGERWSLVLGPRLEYDLSTSTVVASVGRLATGSLFSLGKIGRTTDSIQDVNRVTDLSRLARVAAHLTKDELAKDTVRFDPEQESLVVDVRRKLGSVVLLTYTKKIDVAADAPESLALREGYRQSAWLSWADRRVPQTVYSLEEIDAAIAAPSMEQYGVDPVTNEPLYAYLGGKGNWCDTLEAAMASLESSKRRLMRAPEREALRDIKMTAKGLRAKLVALKNNPQTPQTDALAARELLTGRKYTQEWLDAARGLLQGDVEA